MAEEMAPPPPAEGEAKEQAPEVEALSGEQEAQAALAIVALIDALPGCSSASLSGLDGEGDVVIECVDGEGKKTLVSVSADAIQNAIDEGVEPVAEEVEA